MTKQAYFKEISDVITSELFLTERLDLIEKEIAANCTWLSIEPSIAMSVSSSEFILFLSNVKNEKLLQLQRSGLEVSLLYYLWFDEQAGQLRFNFINSNHQKLPFGCDILIVNSEAEIVDSFLQENKFPQGNDEAATFEVSNSTYVLKVFQEILKF